MDRYWFAKCPKGINSKYPIMVFTPSNLPFIPLSEYYLYTLKSASEGTAKTYVNSLLPFFTFLHERNIIWYSSPESIRHSLFEYLTNKLHCKIRTEPGGSFQLVKLTGQSQSTVNVFLSAIKSFFIHMIDLKEYNYSNPLMFQNNNGDLVRFNNDSTNRMPDISGIPEKQARKFTNTYYKIVGEEWIPNLIDDPLLPQNIFSAGQKVNWSIREILIARMLFESGARISEILGLTIRDYRKRPSINEFNTFSKGSNGKRIKYIRVSADTIKIFIRYINNERILYDKQKLKIDELNDDAFIFLSERSTAYNYKAWYPHWIKACNKANLNVNPHKARHWYVTQAIRTIYETSQNPGDIERRLRELIEYMKWRNDETLEAYQHYFDSQRHAEIHDIVIQNIYKADKAEVQNLKTKKKEEQKLNDEDNNFAFLLQLGGTL